jgi:outer membrane protein insertion porin family
VRSFPAPTTFDDHRDLVIEVEEQRTGQFMMGAGFSSIDKATIFMEISQGNFDLLNWPYFTGGGQKLKLSGQLGTTRRDFLLSFTEPWFFDRKLRFGFDLYDRLVKYDDYDSRRTGGSVRLGKSVGSRGRIDARYSLEKLTISDVADTNEYFTETGESYYFEEEEDNTSSSLRLTYTHDTRNNPFIPSRGRKFRVYGGMTGGALGFDSDFYETGVSFARYIPVVKDHVLSLKVSYDVVEEFGDTDEVPLDDRLFAGGGRTLRGFEYRDVGPKVTREISTADGSVAVDYKPIGGNSRLLASAEYSIPVVTPVRFAMFYDTGNVWAESYDIDFNDLASSFGAGFRFDVPGFPIRIDFAEVIEKDDELTDTEAWVLWIGYDF